MIVHVYRFKLKLMYRDTNCIRSDGACVMIHMVSSAMFFFNNNTSLKCSEFSSSFYLNHCIYRIKAATAGDA